MHCVKFILVKISDLRMLYLLVRCIFLVTLKKKGDFVLLLCKVKSSKHSKIQLLLRDQLFMAKSIVHYYYYCE